MDIAEVKRNLHKYVKYKGTKGRYILTACILRKDEKGYFYQAEIKDCMATSVIICRLDDIEKEVSE